jgi:hypothetical protein
VVNEFEIKSFERCSAMAAGVEAESIDFDLRAID